METNERELVTSHLDLLDDHGVELRAAVQAGNVEKVEKTLRAIQKVSGIVLLIIDALRRKS